MNFAALWLYAKVFSVKFEAWRLLARQKRAIRESFLREKRIFHQFAKVFSHESFPLYGRPSMCSPVTMVMSTINSYKHEVFEF